VSQSDESPTEDDVPELRDEEVSARIQASIQRQRNELQIPTEFVNAIASSANLTAISKAISSIGVNAKMIRDFQNLTNTVVRSSLFHQLRTLDQVMPVQYKGSEMVRAARLAQIALPNSAFSGWRESLATAQSISKIVGAANSHFKSLDRLLLTDLSRVNGIAAALSEIASRQSTLNVRHSMISTPSSHQLRQYLDSFASPPSTQQLSVGAQASYVVAGLVGAELTTLKLRDSTALEGAARKVEIEVVEPWQSGYCELRTEMVDYLTNLDPTISDLLSGAWEEGRSMGSAANVKIATCAVEALQRALRALAPDEEVAAWRTGKERPTSDLDPAGRPTYATRARYVLRENSELHGLVVEQIEAVIGIVPKLRRALEAGKHASIGTAPAMFAHLLSAEAVLIQLTIHRPLRQ
jgi:hypothetical protein